MYICKFLSEFKCYNYLLSSDFKILDLCSQQVVTILTHFKLQYKNTFILLRNYINTMDVEEMVVICHKNTFILLRNDINKMDAEMTAAICHKNTFTLLKNSINKMDVDMMAAICHKNISTLLKNGINKRWIVHFFSCRR